MTAKLSASADGTKVTIGTAAEDALQIDATAKTIKALAPYSLQPQLPAFSATKSVNQAFTGVGSPQITFDVEQFDYGNYFSGNAYNPKVAGVYQVNANVVIAGGNSSYLFAKINKNGTAVLAGSGTQESPLLSKIDNVSVVSGLVYMNGTTDTLTVTATTSTNAGAAFTTDSKFSGALVRAA